MLDKLWSGTMRRLARLAAALLAGAVLMTGCGGGSSSSGTGSSGSQGGAENVAVYAVTTEPMIFWDPSDGFSNEIIAMNNFYETLLRYDPASNSFIKVLATDYKSSPDALTWTFTLRKGVKFHTGKTMTSADVKASFERTMKHGKGAAYILDPIQSIDTPDESTVVFHLKYAAPMDLIVSSPYAAYVFDTDVLKKNGDDWFNKQHEAGTGPYMLKSWKQNDSLVLQKFPDYWGGWKDNQFDTVIIKPVEETSTKMQMLQAGQADVVDQLPYEQLEALKNDPNVEIVRTNAWQNLLAFFNTKKKPLDDVRVRQALSYAFPYRSVIDDVMHGMATQARGPVPAGLWGHDDNLFQYQDDLEKAKQLLDQAGVKPGLKLTLTYTSGDENERRVAELWKAELAKLGITLDIQAMPWDPQWQLAKATDPNKRQDILMMYWWPDYANPYSFLWNMFHSEDTVNFNLAYYSNPEFDKLIDDANQISATDRAQAEAKYAQAQEILVRDAPAVFIYDQNYVRPVRKSFGGYVDNPAYPNVVFFYNAYRK
ncbi:MAG: ABC transporter substrate-binding protein [Clostridia bacterium]|nr:ABC transporter substrate-binding protein [Clostridia bacterium]